MREALIVAGGQARPSCRFPRLPPQLQYGTDRPRHLARPGIEDTSLNRDVATLALDGQHRKQAAAADSCVLAVTRSGTMRIQSTGTSPVQLPRYLVSQKRPV